MMKKLKRTAALLAMGATATIGLGAVADTAHADSYGFGYDLLIQESQSTSGWRSPGYVSYTFSDWRGAYRCFYDANWAYYGYWVQVGDCQWI
jgi:hypothetical protein